MNHSKHTRGWAGAAIMLQLIASAWGQSPPEERKAWAVFEAGPGAATDGSTAVGFVQAGVSGEGVLSGGLGASVGLGYVAGFSGGHFGLFSPGMAYFFNRNQRTVPFVFGGYSLFFSGSTASGVHFGAGVNRWMGEHWGLRFEVRDTVLVEYNAHFVAGQVGIVLR